LGVSCRPDRYEQISVASQKPTFANVRFGDDTGSGTLKAFNRSPAKELDGSIFWDRAFFIPHFERNLLGYTAIV
jgi:hypothetical protein